MSFLKKPHEPPLTKRPAAPAVVASDEDDDKEEVPADPQVESSSLPDEVLHKSLVDAVNSAAEEKVAALIRSNPELEGYIEKRIKAALAEAKKK